MVFQAVSIVLAASLGAALTFAQPVKSSPLSPENRGDIPRPKGRTVSIWRAC